MDTRIVDYDYTPDPSQFQEGKILCLVAAPVSLDTEHQMHRLATIPHGQHFRFEGKLDTGKASHTLLRVRVKQSGSFPLLTCDSHSLVLGFDHCTWRHGRDVIELCAGLGALGQGAIASQFRPCIAVEWRPKLAELYKKNSEAEVIVGDISDFETIRKIHEKHSTSATITSGISCQPYSKLGDGKSGLDPRSQTLPATLAIAHYLRATAVVVKKLFNPLSLEQHPNSSKPLKPNGQHVGTDMNRSPVHNGNKSLHLHARHFHRCSVNAPSLM